MLSTAHDRTRCHGCGGEIAAGDLSYLQPATAGFPARRRHVGCPAPGAGLTRVGDLVVEVLDAVEMRGWPADDPVPLVPT